MKRNPPADIHRIPDATDWGYPIISTEVPRELQEPALEAVRLCPRLALRLECR